MGLLRSYEEASLGDLITEAQALAGSADHRAVNEIVRRFEPLTKKIGRQTACRRVYREDVESAARFALTQAVRYHRGQPETFPAYAKKYMLGAGWREANRWRKPDERSVVELVPAEPADVNTAVTVEEAIGHRGWGFGATADAVATLSPMQQRLLRRRYIDDADLTEIAMEAAVSVPAISQRLRTVHRRLEGALAA